MKLITYRTLAGAPPSPGILSTEGAIDIRPAGYASVIDVAAGGAAALQNLKAFLDSKPAAVSEYTLCAPIQRPSKLICVGLNYRDHAIESKMEIPKVPTIFNKFATSIIGPGDNIVLPKVSTQPDYEAEMAVVIGQGGRHIKAADWQAHVFGYTIVNDVSARDFQMATTQWLMGKTFDTFAPMGPWIVTADEIADPHALDIKLEINGETLQSSNTRHLIFRIPDLIEYLSQAFTLEPGDIISTGTPAGVGFARKPPRLLREGDDVVVTVESIGALRNPVVAEQ